MAKKLEHILYVDDEAHIQEVAKMCLEMVGGFTVTCLNSGTDLVEKFESIGADAILLDVMMPTMDGPSTFAALKEKFSMKTPVIFMTARVQPDDIARYMEMGAAGVVSKPFDPMTLSGQINEIWEKLHANG